MAGGGGVTPPHTLPHPLYSTTLTHLDMLPASRYLITDILDKTNQYVHVY